MAKSDFLQKYGPWAIVAGASEGIGAAFARQLAAGGFSLLLLARREEKLRALEKELASGGVMVRSASVDLGRTDLDKVLADLTAGLEVGLVVYNAAYAGIGGFFTSSLTDKLRHLDVNCRGPLVFCDQLGAPMRARGRGGIILVSSMAGFQGAALISTYAATKAFNTVLAEGLWSELKQEGVDVQVTVAGATRTPGFLQQTPEDKQRAVLPMAPEAVAAGALARLGRPGRGPVFIPGRVNRLVHFFISRLPRLMAVRFMSRNTRRIYGEV